MVSKKSRRVVEPLEERRLFVVYTGTAGADTVIIRAGVNAASSYVSVQINGGAVQTTVGVQVQINTLGGNDAVYFPQLRRTDSAQPSISIDLGDGNDYASTYDPASGAETISNIEFGVNIVGGAGNDALNFDATNGDGIYEQTFSSNRMDFREAINRTGAFTWTSTLESVEYDGSAAAEGFTLDSGTAATKLNIVAGGGDDSFAIGRRNTSVSPNVDINFSSGGWTPGTVTLSGGGGVDTVYIYDKSGAPGTIAEDFFTVSKGSVGFTIPTIEVQRFEPSPGSTVQFNSMSSAFTTTNIWGSSINVNAGNTTNGSFGNLAGTFDLSLSGTGNAINFNDAGNTASSGTYSFDTVSTFFLGLETVHGRLQKNPGSASQTFTWLGTVAVTLNTAQAGTSTYVAKVLADTALAINGGPGADTVRFDAGDVDGTILAPVVVNGGSGPAIDEVSFNDKLDTTAGVVTINGNAFTDNGLTIFANGIENMIIEAGSGPAAAVNVQRVTVQTILSTPATTPTAIGGGNVEANLLNNLYVTNAGVVTVDDHLDTGNDNYFITGLTFYKGNSGRFIEMGTVVSAVLQANDGDDLIQVGETTTNVLSIHANGGNDRIEVADSANFFGTFNIGVDTGSENTGVAPFGDQLVVDSDAGTSGDTGASVRILNDDTVRTLTVQSGGRVVVPTGVVLRATTAISNTGAIDLAGGSLLLSNAAAGTVRSWITTGRNGGTWDGSGPAGAIRSSLANSTATINDAVGYGLGASLTITTVGSFAIAPTDTLVRHTLTGDANLDLTVNFNDLVSLAQNYNASGKGWTQGEFTYDVPAAVGFDDLVPLAQNYNQGFSSALWAQALQTSTDKKKSDGRGPGKLAI